MKKIIIITALLLGSTALFSQERGHFLSVGGTLGSSGLRYDIPQGSVRNGLGFGGQLGYSFFFHENVGVGTGIGISRYETNVRINGDTIIFPGLLNTHGDEHYRIAILRNWRENQRNLFLEIPLLLQFQTKFGRYQTWGMYANLGVKMQIPFSGRYRVTGGSIENQGIHLQWGEDKPPFANLPGRFETDHNFRPSGDVSLRTGVAATAGLGILIELSRAWDLMIGAHFDYGLRDIRQVERHGPIVYINQGDGLYPANRYRSVLASDNIGRVNPLSVGLHVGLRYRLGGSNRPTKQEMIQQEQQAQEEALAEVAAQRAEEAAQRAAIAAAIAQQERDAEAAQIPEELASSLQQIGDLLASTLGRGATVDRVRGVDGIEALKVEFEGDILFATSQSNLSERSMDMLVSVVQILQENPEATIDVFGHTDNVGSLRYNQGLSTRRANSVVNFLVDMGVDRRQIRRVVGRNFSEPIADNSTAEGRAKNRRVEIWMYVDRE